MGVVVSTLVLNLHCQGSLILHWYLACMVWGNCCYGVTQYAWSGVIPPVLVSLHDGVISPVVVLNWYGLGVTSVQEWS
jgi:hypothetical protein